MTEKTVKVTLEIYEYLQQERERLLNEEGLNLPIKSVLAHVFHKKIFKAQLGTKKHDKTQSSTIKQTKPSKQTKQEQAYLLREKEKLTYKQISEKMECTESQVRSLVTKEKAKLKKLEATC